MGYASRGRWPLSSGQGWRDLTMGSRDRLEGLALPALLPLPLAPRLSGALLWGTPPLRVLPRPLLWVLCPAAEAALPVGRGWGLRLLRPVLPPLRRLRRLLLWPRHLRHLRVY